MEVIKQEGKYHLAFESREEAELHAAAVKEQAEAAKGHKALAASIGNLIGHLKHFGIHAEGKAPKTAKEVPLSESHPAEQPISAPPELATPGPVVTQLKPRIVDPEADELELPDTDEKAGALAASEVK